MKDLATAYMARRYARGGRVMKKDCYSVGGEVKEPGEIMIGEIKPKDEEGALDADKVKRSMRSTMGGMNMEKGLEEFMPPMDEPKKKMDNMAMGGLVDEDIDVSGDLDDDMDDLQPDHEVPSQGMSYENMKDDGMMKKRFLSRILSGVMKAHRG